MLELLDIVTPVLLVGLMVASVHTPLGIEVLKRGIIFIDLAIAQIAGLGYIVVEMLSRTVYGQQNHVHSDPTGFALGPSLGALCFALIGGLIFRDKKSIFQSSKRLGLGFFSYFQPPSQFLCLPIIPMEMRS